MRTRDAYQRKHSEKCVRSWGLVPVSWRARTEKRSLVWRGTFSPGYFLTSQSTALYMWEVIWKECRHANSIPLEIGEWNVADDTEPTWSSTLIIVDRIRVVYPLSLRIHVKSLNNDSQKRCRGGTVLTFSSSPSHDATCDHISTDGRVLWESWERITCHHHTRVQVSKTLQCTALNLLIFLLSNPRSSALVWRGLVPWPDILPRVRRSVWVWPPQTNQWLLDAEPALPAFRGVLPGPGVSR